MKPVKYVLIGFTHPQTPNWTTKMVHDVFGPDEYDRAVSTYRSAKDILAHVGLLDVETGCVCDTTEVRWIGDTDQKIIERDTNAD